MPTEISGVEEPPTDFTDAHRWLGCVGFSYGIHSKLGCVRGALGTAWVRQDAIPSYICVNPCYLWETLLYKKVLCRSVKSVGDPSLQEGLCKSVKFVGENRSKKILCRSVKSVGGNHSEKILCRSVKSVEENRSKKVLCRSVKSVGENRSKKAAWVWQGCHTLLH